ncbi:Lrp/AsnC family transcriptional regulator [Peribacillus frigoritolerans]|uniref:Lrp/AsnC family transcriptional regulator n=1 Tax=Peribacillus frigoritolerans TaxID=450367 RepID=UPI0025A0F995|nr:Lrp/AsnC family transcriptional regulator [Peribacillus frigoritolerans]MDM5306816.1 Lrp/AsnC family transcriptional regulator [Peribacillus frigoritolerans]
MINEIDKKILEELSKNNHLVMKKLGKKVHLTAPTTASRIVNLLDNGIIKRCSNEVNQEKLGFSIHAFLNIYIENIHHQSYLAFIETQDNYVINNYKVSGDSCYLLECKFPSNEVLDQFLNDLNKHANYKVSIVIG